MNLEGVEGSPVSMGIFTSVGERRVVDEWFWVNKIG